MEGAKCQIMDRSIVIFEAMKGEDQVTKIIGQVGPFQLFWWATLSFSTILHSLAMMSNKFQLYPIDFWCSRFGSFNNISKENSLRIAPINEDGTYDRCHIFDVPYFSSTNQPLFERPLDEKHQPITMCTEWEYDTSQFKVRKHNILFS